MTTYTHDATTTYVQFRAGEPIAFRMVAPPYWQRSTGTMRYPELSVYLPQAVVSMIAAAPVPAGDGQAVGVAVHLISRRAQAIGPFATPTAAAEWWHVPFNRDACDPDMVFLVATPARIRYEQPALDLTGGAR